MNKKDVKIEELSDELILKAAEQFINEEVSKSEATKEENIEKVESENTPVEENVKKVEASEEVIAPVVQEKQEDTMMKSMIERLEKLESALEKSKKEEMEALSKSKQEEMEELKKSHTSEIESLKKSYMFEMEDLKKSYESKIEDLSKSLTEMKEKMSKAVTKRATVSNTNFSIIEKSTTTQSKMYKSKKDILEALEELRKSGKVSNDDVIKYNSAGVLTDECKKALGM